MTARTVRTALAALAALGVATASASAAVTDLGPYNGVGGFRPQAVNAAGTVAGAVVTQTAPDEQSHAAVWRSGSVTDLGTLDIPAGGPRGDTSEAADVNDAGSVVGVSNADASNDARAFVWPGSGALQDLGLLGASDDLTGARGINAAGQVVGWGLVDGGATATAFAWPGSGALNRLPGANAPDNNQRAFFATGIDDAGAIVGRTASGGRYWRSAGDASPLALPFFPGLHGIAPAGATIVGVDPAGHPVRSAAGAAPEALPLPAGATTGRANAIDKSGRIVGTAGGHAILWAGPTPTDLNGLLTADEQSHWTLTEAYDISDAGHIVGVGTLDGASHGFVLQVEPVSGTVLLHVCTGKACTGKPLKGVTLTATSAGRTAVTATTGDAGTYALALPAGDWTVTPSLRDATFDPESKAVTVAAAPVAGVDFETCGASPEKGGAARLLADSECPTDYEIDAIEVTQGVQAPSWFSAGEVTVPGVGKVPGGTYGPVSGGNTWDRAVTLVDGKPGLVRVYVRLNPSGGTTTVPPVTVAVYAGGRRVGTLAPLSTPGTIEAADDLAGRRADYERTYDFALPGELATAGKLSFYAEVKPPKGKECVTLGGVSCTKNNKWALVGVPVKITQPFVPQFFGSLSPTYGLSGVYRDITLSADQIVQRVAGQDWYLPVKPGDYRPTRGKAIVDTRNVATWALGHSQDIPPITDGLEGCIKYPACTEPMMKGIVLILHIVTPYGKPSETVIPFSVPKGVAGTTNSKWKQAASDLVTRNIIHEYLHIEGLEHASDGSGCGNPADNPEPWPDNVGSLIGYGARPVKAGWKILLPSQWFDVMSYCDTAGNRSAMSNVNWNELVDIWSSRPENKPFGITPRAVVDGLAVDAVIGADGRAPLLNVRPVRATPTASTANGAITVTAYDAAGSATASVQVDDPAASDAFATVSVVLPIREAARIEFHRTSWQPTAVVRSAHAPTVTVAAPRAGTRVRPTTKLRIAWRAADADGGTLTTRIDYSADDGRTWRIVTAGVAGQSITLPAGTLTSARRARLRIAVSDGLNETVKTSARFAVVGSPPTVTLTTARTLRVKKGAKFRLAGYGFDETGAALAARNLRWFDGKKPLGRGESLKVKLTKKGRHAVRLVGTDRRGRMATKVVTVVVS